MKVFIVLLGIALAYFYTQNPLLFGKRTGESSTSSHDAYSSIISEHDTFLDDELFGLSSFLGKEFAPYRNHCLRVLTFTKYFLPGNVLKEIPDAMELVAVALAYHDCALWTDKQLAYLEPSVHQMEQRLLEGSGSSKYSKEQLDLMKDIIMEHHKVTPFESNRTKAADDLVNAVRKADWSDATMGIVRYGMPAELLEATYDKIPTLGFHNILMEMAPRLSPGDIWGQLQVLRILRW